MNSRKIRILIWTLFFFCLAFFIAARLTLPLAGEIRQPLARAGQQFWKLLGSQRAKDFCSCYFVIGQSRENCADWVSHGLPLVTRPFPVIGVEIDEAAKIVSVNGARAQWRSQRFGCILRD
jgi:hypothetical protein